MCETNVLGGGIATGGVLSICTNWKEEHVPQHLAECNVGILQGDGFKGLCPALPA